MKILSTVPRKSSKSSKEDNAGTHSAAVAGTPSPSSARPSAKAKKNGAAPASKAAASKSSKPRKKVKQTSSELPTDEEIRMRAYFIAERRHRLNLPGDASSDWIEARRQLLAGDATP
jgi:hypothetical protein